MSAFQKWDRAAESAEEVHGVQIFKSNLLRFVLGSFSFFIPEQEVLRGTGCVHASWTDFFLVMCLALLQTPGVRGSVLD